MIFCCMEIKARTEEQKREMEAEIGKEFNALEG